MLFRIDQIEKLKAVISKNSDADKTESLPKQLESLERSVSEPSGMTTTEIVVTNPNEDASSSTSSVIHCQLFY